MQRHLLRAAVLALVSTLAHAAPSGIAKDQMDPSVRPQNDFYGYVNGNWEKTVQIPADMPMWGTFVQVGDETQSQLRAIVEKAAASTPAAGTDAQRIGDFYASFMDEGRVESLGIAPLRAELDGIAAVKDKSQLAPLMAHLARIGITVPLAITIHQDNKDATRYVADIGQSGLGLPDRDYYVDRKDTKMADVRAKYVAHVERLLGLAGREDAGAGARAIVDFETALAGPQWTATALRDPVKAYNKLALADLGKLAPGFDWAAWLDATGIAGKESHVIAAQPGYLTAFARLADETPLATWKSYLALRVVEAYSPYLSKAFVDESFAFNGRVLTGATQQRPRWKKALGQVEQVQGEALGKLYVAEHFPAERRARIETMVGNLLAAYRQDIDKLDWMGAKTKKEAQAKLAKLTYNIGYPTVWRDYSGLEIKRDDLAGNMMRARAFDYEHELHKLGGPIDRTEWTMTPQTINCEYNPELNTVVVPAAVLQPPFFDPNAEDAVNYGAIGAMIGHELSHAFDDQGGQYDGDGNLRNWWTPQDHKRFEAKGKMLVRQYGAFEPVPGYHVNGELTLGENIADVSGLSIAYKAYGIALKGAPAPTIDGFTGAQRFYMGWAHVWRRKVRDAFALQLLKMDVHSPDALRANGTVRNEAGFYDAFGVQPGDKMYLAPAKRVTIW